MTIVRDGKGITLTKEELVAAHAELEVQHNRMDIEVVIDEWLEMLTDEENLAVLKEILRDEETMMRLSYEKSEEEVEQRGNNGTVDWRQAVGDVLERELSHRRQEREVKLNKYFVSVCRLGGIHVKAKNKEEAMDIADGQKTNTISWDDDWDVTDVCEDDEWPDEAYITEREF